MAVASNEGISGALPTVGGRGRGPAPDDQLQAMLLRQGQDRQGPPGPPPLGQLLCPQSLIEVKPRKTLPSHGDAFMQMVHERSNTAGLSAADQKVMRNPQRPMGNFREMLGGTAQQIVQQLTSQPSGGSKTFISEKLLQRERHLKAEADQDLQQILQAQQQQRVDQLGKAFPQPGGGQLGKAFPPRAAVPRHEEGREGCAGTVLPRLEGDVKERLQGANKALIHNKAPRPRGIRPRPTSLPSVYSQDQDAHGGYTRSVAKRSRQGFGCSNGEADELDCEEVPDTEPANREPPKKELSPEEQVQQLVLNTCSQCRHGRFEDIKHAIEHGMPVDAHDEHGNTLLVIACQNNHKKIVKLLMKHGADVQATNHKGYDAVHYAKLYKHDDLLRYLGF